MDPENQRAFAENDYAEGFLNVALKIANLLSIFLCIPFFGESHPQITNSKFLSAVIGILAISSPQGLACVLSAISSAQYTIVYFIFSNSSNKYDSLFLTICFMMFLSLTFLGFRIAEKFIERYRLVYLESR